MRVAFSPVTLSDAMALLKSIALLALSFGKAWSLAPGDCAFVGIYGEKDDFAILLMEDADGEKISLTDGNFKDKNYQSSQRAQAKAHVKDAVKGTVLRKSDFQTEDGWSFAAPLALTVFKGSPSSPTALCGVSLDGKAGNMMARRLDDEVAALNLGETETAQYAGPMVGSKGELLDGISNPMNWLRDAGALRKLSGFSIAMGQNSTTSMTTTSMEENTTSTTMTTTLDEGGTDAGVHATVWWILTLGVALLSGTEAAGGW